jgi:hypothetical protein
MQQLRHGFLSKLHHFSSPSSPGVEVAHNVIRFHYNAWRPETALHYTPIWLPSGHSLSQPDYKPLITPTPIEQEYTSGHASVGGAGATVLRAFNGGDEVDVTISSLVAQSPQHVLTRRFTNLSVAAQEISDSRVFGGVSAIPRPFQAKEFLKLAELGLELGFRSS